MTTATPPPRARMGLTVSCYCQHMLRAPGVSRAFPDALAMLQHAHSLGAGGVQLEVADWDASLAGRIRAFAEDNHLRVEGQVSLPKPGERDRFARDLRMLREAGGTIARAVFLNGRRYEVFKTVGDVAAWWKASVASMRLAEPVARKLGVIIALENHKDVRNDEMVGLLRMFSSRFVRACGDFGNSMALLEDPIETANALAPFAVTTHVKDMAVKRHSEGFLLSEVPLGEGVLDLSRLAEIYRAQNPHVHFDLEMITRDPLVIPCLGTVYSEVLPRVPARDLGRALGLVAARGRQGAMPGVTGLSREETLALEVSNIRKCLAYGRAHMNLG
jgi:sugar phosphate isomerase/epimerase